MNITVNGKRSKIAREEITLVDILSEHKVERPDMVAVQLNGVFIERDRYEHTMVHENDMIDFVYFMGGGASI